MLFWYLYAFLINSNKEMELQLLTKGGSDIMKTIYLIQTPHSNPSH